MRKYILFMAAVSSLAYGCSDDGTAGAPGNLGDGGAHIEGGSDGGNVPLPCSGGYTLDTTFASGGVLLEQDTAEAYAPITLVNGALYWGRQEPERVRLDGTVEHRFTLPDTVIPSTMAVQPDGAVVFAYSTDVGSEAGYARGIALTRLRPDGTLDSGFGKGGTATTTANIDPTSQDTWSDQVVITPTGHILVVAGRGPRNVTSVPADFSILRFTKDGSLDTGFGTGGFVNAGSTQFDEPHGLLVLGDGSMALGNESEDAYVGAPSVQLGEIYRFDANGARVTTFGDDGVLSSKELDDLEVSPSLYSGPNGSYIVRGRIFMRRVLADGTIDPAFGNGGELQLSSVRVDDTTSIDWLAVSEAPDGSLAFAGTYGEYGAEAPEIRVARYTADGQACGAPGSHALGRPTEVIDAVVDAEGSLYVSGGARAPGAERATDRFLAKFRRTP